MPPPNINELGLLLFGTARAWRTKLDQRLRPLGLSQGKWRTLIHLSQGGNKLTQKEIAERMGIEGATLAGLLDRFQEDGWIERHGFADDRRCKIVHLQRRSKAVLDKIFNTAHGLRTELIEDVSARDLEACIRVLTQIRKKAEPAGERRANGHSAANVREAEVMTTMAKANLVTRDAVEKLEHRFGRKRLFWGGGAILLVVLLLTLRGFMNKPKPRRRPGRGRSRLRK